MTKRSAFSVIVCLAVATLGFTSLVLRAADEKATGSDDKDFVTKAAQGGMAEVKLGELAKEKAASDDVKRFGEMMVHDHTKANDELKKVAEKKEISLPTDLGKLQSEYDRLSKLSGSEFDHAYMKMMVKDHTEDVSEFEAEANNGQDPDVKKWASDTLPTLKDHLKAAHETMHRLNGGAATKPSI